jgi:hypothetical protein
MAGRQTCTMPITVICMPGDLRSALCAVLLPGNLVASVSESG